jgi:hypothetical protein
MILVGILGKYIDANVVKADTETVAAGEQNLLYSAYRERRLGTIRVPGKINVHEKYVPPSYAL